VKAFEGRLITVVVEDGDEIVEHPGSVAIVAVDAGGRVVLVRQLRRAAGKVLVELPAGARAPGEEPGAAARRELAEETGLRAERLTLLASFWTTPGFVREQMHVFLAEGCTEGESAPEADEDIELVRWSRDQVDRRVAELEDAKTIAGLLLWLRARP
jgi:ADP-ribose pyrophosphatase